MTWISQKLHPLYLLLGDFGLVRGQIWMAATSWSCTWRPDTILGRCIGKDPWSHMVKSLNSKYKEIHTGLANLSSNQYFCLEIKLRCTNSYHMTQSWYNIGQTTCLILNTYYMVLTVLQHKDNCTDICSTYYMVLMYLLQHKDNWSGFFLCTFGNSKQPLAGTLS